MMLWGALLADDRMPRSSATGIDGRPFLLDRFSGFGRMHAELFWRWTIDTKATICFLGNILWYGILAYVIAVPVGFFFALLFAGVFICLGVTHYELTGHPLDFFGLSIFQLIFTIVFALLLLYKYGVNPFVQLASEKLEKSETSK